MRCASVSDTCTTRSERNRRIISGVTVLGLSQNSGPLRFHRETNHHGGDALSSRRCPYARDPWSALPRLARNSYLCFPVGGASLIETSMRTKESEVLGVITAPSSQPSIAFARVIQHEDHSHCTADPPVDRFPCPRRGRRCLELSPYPPQ